MSATTANGKVPDQTQQLKDLLVASGDWEKILATVTRRLQETGWEDGLRDKAKETARHQATLSLPGLMSSIKPHAKATVPDDVRKELEAVIRSYAEKHVEL